MEIGTYVRYANPSARPLAAALGRTVGRVLTTDSQGMALGYVEIEWQSGAWSSLPAHALEEVIWVWQPLW